MTRSAWACVVATAALLTTLVACTPLAPEAEPTSAPPTTSAPSPSATPTPTTTPEPEFVVACDTIVPPSRRDSLTAFGLSETPAADFFAKVRSEVEASPYFLMHDSGGVVCSWHKGYEILTAYGYAPLSPGQVAEAEALIAGMADTFETSVYATGTLWTSTYEENAFRYFLVTSDGIYVATATELIDEMLARVS